MGIDGPRGWPKSMPRNIKQKGGDGNKRLIGLVGAQGECEGG